jgi:predicted kinase
VGAPASGKSTYAATLGLAVHSRDDVRERWRVLHPGVTVDENWVWRTFLDEAAADIREGRGVVLDSTLATTNRRNEAVDFFQRLGCEVVIHRMRTPLALCRWYNAQRHLSTRVVPADITSKYAAIEHSFAVDPPLCTVVDVRP